MKVIMGVPSVPSATEKSAENSNRIIKFARVLIKADHALPASLRRGTAGGSMGLRGVAFVRFCCAALKIDPK